MRARFVGCSAGAQACGASENVRPRVRWRRPRRARHDSFVKLNHKHAQFRIFQRRGVGPPHRAAIAMLDPCAPVVVARTGRVGSRSHRAGTPTRRARGRGPSRGGTDGSRNGKGSVSYIVNRDTPDTITKFDYSIIVRSLRVRMAAAHACHEPRIASAIANMYPKYRKGKQSMLDLETGRRRRGRVRGDVHTHCAVHTHTVTVYTRCH
jgi:hypothetical protein